MATVATFINVFLTVLWLAIIGRVIVSWINVSPSNPLVAIIYQVSEPILAPIRRFLPKSGTFDFAPMVAIFLIFLVQRFILPRF